MRVILSNQLRDTIFAHARASYPNECCGLVTGTISDAIATIIDVHLSANLTSGDPARSFEVDPKLRFDVMRDAQSRNDGIDIIGHFHSHPDGPAEPSATDLSMVYEPQMIWLICNMTLDGIGKIGAFKPNTHVSAFTPLELAATSE